jgi:hypothetical protein
VELDDVADRLYALPPEDFTAARGAAAKEAGGKELRDAVKALRRPTVSAWLVNRLATEQPDLLDDVLALGPELAEAQREGQGEALRALGQQRRELVAAVTRTAVDGAGRTVTAQVRTEVEQTLEAALADPASADAVRSGRLVRALAYAGFGGVDLEGAVAVPAKRRRTAAPTPDVTAAEIAALDAAAALDAVRACESADQRAAAAEDDARRAADELTAAREGQVGRAGRRAGTCAGGAGRRRSRPCAGRRRGSPAARRDGARRAGPPATRVTQRRPASASTSSVASEQRSSSAPTCARVPRSGSSVGTRCSDSRPTSKMTLSHDAAATCDGNWARQRPRK